MRRRLMTTAVVLAAALATAAQASADCRKKMTLTPVSPVGTSMDTSGSADARADGTQQRFKVSMDARVPDGSTFTVWANGQVAGTITIQLGAGELELNNNNGKVLPAAVNPVCSVSTVTVTGTSGAVLQGAF